MSTNPLKKAAAAPPSSWTAMDYYRRAIETGQGEKARLWLEEAKRLGEVPDRADLS